MRTTKDRTRFLANPAALLPNPDVFDEKDYADRVIGAGFAPRGGSASAKATVRDWAEDPGGVLIDTSLGEVWVLAAIFNGYTMSSWTRCAKGSRSSSGTGRPFPPGRAWSMRSPRPSAPRAAGPSSAARTGSRVRASCSSEKTTSHWPTSGIVAPRGPAWSAACPASADRFRAHQLEGVGALQRLWVEGWSGALLCDDMGLGKTMQALAFAAWARRHMPDVDVPIVVVAPPSLLGPWLQEMTDKLDDDLLPRIIWGPRDPPPQGVPRQVQRLEDFLIGETRSTSPVLANVSIDLPRLRAAKPDVLFVGYDALRRYQFALGKLHFGCVIADEAQEAKDPNSLRSRALRAMNYEFALVLTGTPIENAWRDLWTLCDVAVPGMLGTLRQFGQEYTSESDVRSTGEKLAQELSRVLIRRTRATTLADLPPREVKVVQREMSPEQSLAYQSALSRRSGGNAPILGLLGDLSRISLHPRIRTDLRSKEEALEWVGASARTSVAWEALARFARERTAVLVFVRSLAMQSSLNARSS
ncbi:MAG: hypothetical protein IPI35_29905 [Deltaproteobacteria bacterium]|nr:hypothetical protein [Deltaproteobacteria bacterium]